MKVLLHLLGGDLIAPLLQPEDVGVLRTQKMLGCIK